MLVDDEPLSLLILASQFIKLSKKNFSIILASSGVEAIGILHDINKSIKFIVTDNIMPEMSGIELTSICRKLYPKIKIALISAAPVTEQHNCDTVLLKPLTESNVDLINELSLIDSEDLVIKAIKELARLKNSL